MSEPRVSRTVVGTPRARNRRTNSRSTPGSEAVHFEPGVGFSGIGLTCTQPRPRALSLSPSRSARQPWSFMLRIRAYSMLTRRPVTVKYRYAASIASCLLYTSDAADDLTRVDLGG